jgi:hypothetical protein
MLARLTSDFLYIVTIRRPNHERMGLCKHRCTFVGLCRHHHDDEALGSRLRRAKNG